VIIPLTNVDVCSDGGKEDIAVCTLYEKRADGSLKPIEQPEQLVVKVATYQWLKAQGLGLDEIKFLWNITFVC
jgi:hypothetical protein